jgi:hypothetical protein
MEQVLAAQQDLEVVMTALLPLVPFVDEKNSTEARKMLLEVLKQALATQRTSSKRATELKTLKPEAVMSFFSPNAERAGAARENDKKASVAATPPRKGLEKKVEAKANRAQRRTRKRSESAKEKEEEEEEYAEPSTKKSVIRKAVQGALVVWSGDEVRRKNNLCSALKPLFQYPKITKAVMCQGEGPDFSIDVYAKQAGRGICNAYLFC